MRRDPQAILTAFKMDPRRRVLYVEGIKDKHFLEWLTHPDRDPDAMIDLIEQVDIPDCTEGGNRARLISFMEMVISHRDRMRGLIDADAEYLKDSRTKYPENVWLTDWRSIESYVLSIDTLNTTLILGCEISSITAEALFGELISASRKMASIRFVSESNDLEFPVSSHRWLKKVKFNKKGGIHLDVREILSSLMGSSGTPLSLLGKVEKEVLGAHDRFSNLDDRHVVHGKDFMALLTRQIHEMGVRTDDAGRMLWTSFRKDSIHEHVNLQEIVRYLSIESNS